jgi:hypothetical protein
MKRFPSPAALLVAGLAGALLLPSAPAEAQGGWVQRARDAARGTGVGRSVLRTTAEAQLLDATRILLDDAGLPTLAVGALALGISAVDVRDGAALRLHAYLYNSATEAATVPVPDADLFVLVDEQGRRPTRLGDVQFEGLEEGAGEIVVPALERVEFTILYAEVPAGAKRGTLKVGALGMIPGIPLSSTAGAPANASAAAQPASVWTAPPAQSEPAMPDSTAGPPATPQPTAQ